MKKFMIVFAFLLSNLAATTALAQTNMSNYPDIVFIRGVEYTYTPVGATEQITVNVLDINGFHLFEPVPNTIPASTTVPTVKLGRINLRVLQTVIIPRATAEAHLSNHQVIAQVPDSFLDGTYEIDFRNGLQLSPNIISDVTIHANLPSAFSSKMALLWTGTMANIPTGWQLCDGSNSTPNSKNKFIVGAGNTYATGATGGRKTIAGHALTITQIPSHNHSYRAGGSSSQNVKMDNDVHVVQGLGNRTTGSKGGSATHSHGDNRPPYLALPIICKK